MKRPKVKRIVQAVSSARYSQRTSCQQWLLHSTKAKSQTRIHKLRHIRCSAIAAHAHADGTNLQLRKSEHKVRHIKQITHAASSAHSHGEEKQRSRLIPTIHAWEERSIASDISCGGYSDRDKAKLCTSHNT